MITTDRAELVLLKIGRPIKHSEQNTHSTLIIRISQHQPLIYKNNYTFAIIPAKVLTWRLFCNIIYANAPFVKILTGIRRCGKSTILKMKCRK